MRLFTAIEISAEARNHLEGVKGFLRNDELDVVGINQVKWVQGPNLHITLKFLGEVPANRVSEIQTALRGISTEPMELFADRFERFPPSGPARVLAAGVGGDAGRVELLFGKIQEACVDFEIAVDRRKFTPHVTIGRSRDGVRIDQASLAHMFPGPVFRATSFALVQSTLTSSAPVYEPIETFLSRE